MTAPPQSSAAVEWLTDDEQRVWRAFLTGSRRLAAQLDADLKDQGLNHDDYGVLVTLSESEGGRLRMSELAQHLVESRSRLSHHVGRLESRDLVVREQCPEDRRGSYAVLTPAGRSTIEAVAPHHVTSVRKHFMDHLSPAELQAIGSAFAQIDAHLCGGSEPTT